MSNSKSQKFIWTAKVKILNKNKKLKESQKIKSKTNSELIQNEFKINSELIQNNSINPILIQLNKVDSTLN